MQVKLVLSIIAKVTELGRKLRIAFLTPEYVTERTKLGGIAGFVYRMTKTLKDMGHIPEVFTRSLESPGPIEHEGIRVERVNHYTAPLLRQIRGIALKYNHHRYIDIYNNLCFAIGMAQAVSKRRRKISFDFIHSSDFYIPGLFIRKRSTCPLIVRSSWVRDLCMEAEGLSEIFGIKCVTMLERMLIRRADVAYAPSKFAAQYYSKRYNLKVHRLLPPFFLDSTIDTNFLRGLPDKFLIHFGNLGPVKGTDILAEALSLVWQEEPELKIVMAGKEAQPGVMENSFHIWGDKSSNVIWLGEIEKPQLYGILKKAVAAVLPSRYDNLPNTAIESLSIGTPVIGTYGSSLDELIESGVCGELVPIGDSRTLSRIMCKVWRGEESWIGNGYRPPEILQQMDPNVAAMNLLQLAACL